MSAGRYTLARYEDLADRGTMRSELRRLYRFMEVPLPEQALEQYIETHYRPNAEKELGKRGTRTHQGDFDTKRSTDFNPNSWKDKLSDERLKEIEVDCRDIMKRFGYERTQLD